jgi:hypothetical protein
VKAAEAGSVGAEGKHGGPVYTLMASLRVNATKQPAERAQRPAPAAARAGGAVKFMANGATKSRAGSPSHG